MEWRVEPGLTPYPHAVATMEARAAAVRDAGGEELIWLVEHPPLYTAGTSAAEDELLEPSRFPVFVSGRGGRYTYHGPGQRVVYVIADLDKRGRDIRGYVASLEGWAIAALGQLGVTAYAVPGRVGVWVDTAAGEAKIGAIGVRVRRWVTYHGFALNVSPDLGHFAGIVPCGLPEFAVTSLAALDSTAGLPALDAALAATVPPLLR
ncbi:lipoyl(octanoyl) transferase LipB [Sphingosinicellaceae bacterium]|nr:lipoyl(octanoyl) transferase LipB [Sphingosinicellaceae bacterium]